MKAPIIVDARSELLFFKSAGAAQGYIEEMDVKNDEYGAVYDADGRQYKLVVCPHEIPIVGPLTLRTEVVSLEPSEVDLRRSREELRQLLVKFVGPGEDRDAATLGELIRRGVERCGWC